MSGGRGRVVRWEGGRNIGELRERKRLVKGKGGKSRGEEGGRKMGWRERVSRKKLIILMMLVSTLFHNYISV